MRNLHQFPARTYLQIRLARRAVVGLMLGAACLVLTPVAASADTFLPGEGASGPPSLVGFLEAPAANARVPATGTFQVRGWVVDRTAEGWSGVNRIEVFDGRSETGGRLLASGSANVPRPDVAAFLNNPYWEPAGFNLAVTADDLAWGTHTLSVYAVTPGRGRWLLTTAVRTEAEGASPGDAFPSDPQIRVLDPLPSEVVRVGARVMRGNALDRNSSVGTGVDRVEVYLGPRDTGGRLLAAAELGKRYGEPGFELGDSRFDSAGWDLAWDPRDLGAGEKDLFVYARRAGTNVWNLQQVHVTILL